MSPQTIDLIGPLGRMVQFVIEDEEVVAVVVDDVAFTPNGRLTEVLVRHQSLLLRARAELTDMEFAEFIRDGMARLEGMA